MRYFPYNHLFEAPISRRYTLRRLIILSVLSVMFGTGFVHDASSQTSGNLCGVIKSPDKRNFCFAKAQNNLALCGGIKENDERYLCFALIRKNKGLCASIKSKDKRYECYLNF